MRHKILFTLSFCIFLNSCGGYKVITIENNDSFSKIYRMTGNFTPVDKSIVGSYGNFQITGEAKLAKSDSAITYCLVVSCLVQNGLYIKNGKSLNLIIDGKQIWLKKNQVPYKSEEINMSHQRYILEVAWYDVEKSVMQNIQDATKIEFIVEGKQTSIEGNFTRENLDNFKTFIKQYVL
jgi:hypothetical protein